MVVWFATSFGWTEIVFGVFLEKLMLECGIQGRPVRKCRYYNKGPKPTLQRKNSGLTGTALLIELQQVLRMEIAHQNPFPDFLVVSDDTDCRVVYHPSERAYRYNSQKYRNEVLNLSGLVQAHHPDTKLVFMLAAPEIESWFLADCENSYCREFPGFTLQSLEKQCKNILPMANLENFCTDYTGNTCGKKLSDDCIRKYPGVFKYSKRSHGQIFLERIKPARLCSLKHFFAPAYHAIKNRQGFVPDEFDHDKS